MKTGDFHAKDCSNLAATSTKLQSDTFSQEKTAMSQQQQRQMISTSSGTYNKKEHVSQSSHVRTVHNTVTTTSQMSSSSCQSVNGNIFDDDVASNFEDLERLCTSSNQKDVEMVISKYTGHLSNQIKSIARNDSNKKPQNALDKINELIRRAWAIPTHGHELGASLCNSLRVNGGLDLLMRNCTEGDKDLQFSSARLLEQCLTTENRSHVVENGLDKVVNVACICTRNTTIDHSRVGTGILEHLFKHSEGTCSDVIRLGGLDSVLFE